VGGADRRPHREEARAQHAADLGGEGLPVPLRVLQRAPRVRVLVTSAEHHEEGGRARVGALDLRLGEPGVVAPDLVEVAAECRVVAGVAEQHRPQRPVLAGDLQHRHVVVHRPVRVDADPDPLGGEAPPVGREVDGAVPHRELSGREVLEGLSHDLHQAVDQLRPVGVDAPPVLLVEVVEDGEVVPHRRAAVRMRGAQHERLALHLEPRPDPVRHRVRDRPREADEVGRDEDRLALVAVPQGERLRPEVLVDAFRGLGAGRVA